MMKENGTAIKVASRIKTFALLDAMIEIENLIEKETYEAICEYIGLYKEQIASILSLYYEYLYNRLQDEDVSEITEAFDIVYGDYEDSLLHIKDHTIYDSSSPYILQLLMKIEPEGTEWVWEVVSESGNSCVKYVITADEIKNLSTSVE